MLSIAMLSVVMLSVTMLSVVMLSVVMLSIVMLSVLPDLATSSKSGYFRDKFWQNKMVLTIMALAVTPRIKETQHNYIQY